MKHLKRWLALALALCLALGIVPAGVLAAEPAAEPAAEEVKVFRPDLSRWPLTFSVDENGNAVITGTTAEKTGTDTLVIPSIVSHEYDDYSVRAIAPGAFEGCSMEKISVESGLETIGAGAFKNCTGLQKIWLPDTVTTVEENAFAGCTALNEAVYGGEEAGWAGITFAAGNEALSELVPALGQLMPGTKGRADDTWKIDYRVSPEADGVILTKCGKNYSMTLDLSFLSTELPVTCIGRKAFNGKRLISEIILPESVTEIGDEAFNGCAIAAFSELPAGLTWIGDSAFASCAGMKLERILPEGLTHLGSGAFSSCTSLTGVPVIPESLESFPAGVFDSCLKIQALDADPGNPVYRAVDGMLLTKDGSALVAVPGGLGGRIRVPEGVTVIRSHAIEGRLVNTIELPAGFKQLEPQAIHETKIIYLPASLEKIQGDTDWITTAAGTIYYEGTEEQRHALGMKTSGRETFSASREVLPEILHYGTAYLSYRINAEGTADLVWLYSCTGETLEFPQEIETADGTKVKVTGIGANFMRQNGNAFCFTSIVIPEGIERLEEHAFEMAISALHIRLPATLTDCEPGALEGMNALESFEVAEDNPIFRSENGLLLSKDGSTLLRVPNGRGSLEIPKSVTQISGEIFKEVKELGNPMKYPDVEREKCITVDPENTAFMFSAAEIEGDGIMPLLLSGDAKTVILNPQCGYLGDGAVMTLPDTVTAIGDYAFYSSEKKEMRVSNAELQLPAELTSIGAHAFEGDLGLTVSALPEKLTSIGAQAFPAQWAANDGWKLTIPASVTELGGNPFTSCRFDAIELAEGNESFKIQNDLLMSADGKEVICGANTETICIPEGVTVIREGAFKNCDRLVNLILPQSLTSIEAEAFAYCSGLKEMNLPRSLINIGEAAFNNCDGLTQLVLPPDLKNIPYDAFLSPDRLMTLVLPRSVERIGPYAFGIFPKTAAVYYPGTEEEWKQVHVEDALKQFSTLPTIAIRFGEPDFSGLTGIYQPKGSSCIVHYTVNEGSQGVTITGISGTQPETLTIPEEVIFQSLQEKLPVTAVAETAFKDCTGITGLKSENERFMTNTEGTMLLTADGKTLLLVLPGLTGTVSVPAGVTTVAAGAFRGCQASAVLLPEGLTSVGGSAFAACPELTEIYLPASLESLGADALTGCEKLAAISFGGTKKQWDAITGGSSPYDPLVQTEAYPDSLKGLTLTLTVSPEAPSCTDTVTVTVQTEKQNAENTNPLPASVTILVDGKEAGTVKTPSGSLTLPAQGRNFTVTASVEGSRFYNAASAEKEVTVCHDWNEPTYEWDEDFSACTATRVCKNDPSHVETAEATRVSASLTREPTCTEPGEITCTATFSVDWAETQKAVAGYTDPLGHDWGETTYKWDEDYAACTATRVCKNDPSHVETAEATRVSAAQTKSPTCTEPGEITCTATFSVDWAETQNVVAGFTDPLGHDWNEPTYEWNDDYSACTATRVCKRDKSHIETAEAVVTSKQKDPQIGVEGEITYTAAFQAEWAETQVKTVKLPALEPEEDAADHFTDIGRDAWYLEAVNYAFQHKLFGGMSENTFEPETPMNRAMLVTVLWRYEGEPEKGQNDFTDVPADEWYTKAVAWAAHNEIVNGVGNGCFEPETDVTREQMAAILYRYANWKKIKTEKRGDLSVFPDASQVSTGWALEPVQWAVGEGLINGSDGKLLPQGPATRAQVATILMRFIKAIALT